MISRNCYAPLGSITSAQAALGVTARDAHTVDNLSDAKKCVIDINNEYHDLMQFRVITDGSENDKNVYEIYATRGKGDDYVHVATITSTQGTQDKSASEHYSDSLAPVVHDHTFQLCGSHTDANGIASLWLKTNGYRRFVIIASTLATTTAKWQYAFVDGCPVTQRVASNAMQAAYHVTGSGAGDDYRGPDTPCTEVLVKGHPDNTGKIWVQRGAAATTSNGWPLGADEYVGVSIDSLSELNIHIVVDGEKAIVLHTK